MSFLPQEIIRAKRDGQSLHSGDIARFVAGLTDGTVSEGQVAAFAMAVFFNGMTREEAVALTLAMRDSGSVLAWDGWDRPVVDKHSTGGVGDNVSLMLAPMAAACGLAVPMISGRGLGHTGGTLDKMGAIPGYQVMPDNALFRRTVKDCGCAIIGQTGDLAPADKRFYAIRDVTATVESVPLITASILSKKLAAGLQALVLDVKCGNGAFMDDEAKAHTLARSLVEVSTGSRMPAVALVTDMNEPLASAAGNALEVINAIDFLTGKHRDLRLETVTVNLCAAMLVAGGLVATVAEGEVAARKALDSGYAAEVFSRMVAALGGPSGLVDNPSAWLEAAPVIRAVPAPRSGVITAWKTRETGLVVVAMKGGRTRPQDEIDPAVGLTRLLSTGTRVNPGDPIGFVHARTEGQADTASAQLLAALTISEEPAPPRHVVLGVERA